MELRDYQRAAADDVCGALDAGGSALLVAPTGSGKTVMFAAVVARHVAAGGRALVVAHRRELLAQAHDKLAAAGVSSAVYRTRKAPPPEGARVVEVSVAAVLERHLATDTRARGCAAVRLGFAAPTTATHYVALAASLLGDPGSAARAMRAAPAMIDQAGRLGAPAADVALLRAALAEVCRRHNATPAR